MVYQTTFLILGVYFVTQQSQPFLPWKPVMALVPRIGRWTSPYIQRSLYREFYVQRRMATTLTEKNSDGDNEDNASKGNHQNRKYYKLHGATLIESTCGVSVSTDTHHTIQTDLPKKMGGKDVAPQPVELLLTSWMGCTQATALFVARQMRPRITLNRLEFVNIEAWRDERGALELPIVEKQSPSVPSRLQEISGQIVVHTKAPLGPEELDTLRQQTEWRCPVANMIEASGCSLNLEWVASNGI